MNEHNNPISLCKYVRQQGKNLIKLLWLQVCVSVNWLKCLRWEKNTNSFHLKSKFNCILHIVWRRVHNAQIHTYTRCTWVSATSQTSNRVALKWQKTQHRIEVSIFLIQHKKTPTSSLLATENKQMSHNKNQHRNASKEGNETWKGNKSMIYSRQELWHPWDHCVFWRCSSSDTVAVVALRCL